MTTEQNNAVFEGLPPAEFVPDPFVLLEHVSECTEESLAAETSMQGQWWQVIEAAAQACSYHQRWRSDFADHCFLLSVDKFALRAPVPRGTIRIAARLTGQSKMAACYSVSLTKKDTRASEAAETSTTLDLTLTIGHVPYAGEAHRRQFFAYYRECWAWLTEER